MAYLEVKWNSFEPTHPFAYTFLDESLNQYYATEQRLMQTLSLFAMLAIFIACLGLFGLATHVAQQRTKEVGIRKVLGASVSNLIVLLSKDFALLVFIGFIVATPLAYVAATRWLEGFVYRITLSPTLFLITGLLTLAIAFLTVSYQAYRVAVANPVKALHYE